MDTGGETSMGAASSGGTGEPACADPETQALYADADTAILADPMGLGFADMLQRDVARSHTAEMGTLTLAFETTCAGPVFFSALLWDYSGGIDPDNPDSLYFTIDDGEEQTWLYGCRTEEDTDQRWWWLPLEAWGGSACDHALLDLELAAGPHTLVIRNREAGLDIDVAAIAAIMVSHDIDADPTQFIDPPS